MMMANAAVRSFEKNADGVTFATDEGILKIQIRTDNIARVIASPPGAPLPEVRSFVVVREWPAPTFSVDESKEAVTLRTREMQVRVNRDTGAVSFLDASGKVFLAERPRGREFAPVVLQGVPSLAVGQSFASEADEKLFGLGQFQDGLWDWRGLSVELRQLNTHIAVPVLVSSKGYGLLWDNASRTEFNPPGDEVTLSAGTSTAGGPTATEQINGAATPAKNAVPARQGTFTAGAAGDYVFSIRDGDRREEISILVDGVQIAGVTNFWTPRSIVGRVTLPANKTCNVTVRGGGKDAKLFARPAGDSTTFRSDYGEAVDYTVFYGPKLDRVIAGYRLATGTAPLWPKWAYGFWQCRERYSSQKQLLDTAAEFRRRGIPVDLIVQDWKYWGPHGWGSYQWDEKQYPDPAALIKGLHDLNMKFMISVWCNPGGVVRREAEQNKVQVGQWLDLFSPKGREIRWRFLNEAFFAHGTDAWWGDATEPGDAGTDLLGKKVSLGAGDRYTNAYALFASQSIYEGQRATNPDKRVVTLTRSAFPGQQRYATALWSGDIGGDWTAFKRQIPAGLNFSLTGQPYWTTDCGGFFRPKDQYKSADYNELLVRWFQWSTFCPILRVHGYQSETEPWKFLPATEKVMLAFNRLRYRMLPYNYTLGARANLQDDTIMRPLVMDFPEDAKALTVSDSYLHGPAFLVTPVTEAKATQREVYLPSGAGWVDFWTGETLKGGETVNAAAPLEHIPLFVRAGSIVPLGPDLQYANEKPAEVIELRVYPGADGAFSLYEDTGDGYAYEKGERATIPFSWNDKTRTLTIGARKGSFPGMLAERTFRVVLVRKAQGTGIAPAEKADRELRYRGEQVSVQF